MGPLLSTWLWYSWLCDMVIGGRGGFGVGYEYVQR